MELLELLYSLEQFQLRALVEELDTDEDLNNTYEWN